MLPEVVQVTEADMPKIDTWWEGWGMVPPTRDWYSTTGLWVPDVCALWIYATDSGKAYIDETISNPNSTKEQRRSAVMAIGIALDETVKRMGYRYLIGSTKLDSVSAQMEAAGWKPYGPHRIFVKDLAAI